MRAKVLTVKQPWASLIVHGIKDIENRSWQTNFRGRVLIFGCLQPNQRLKVLNTPMSRIGFNDLPFGSIIGSVEIVDCVQNHPSIWADKGVYHWVLANPVLFEKPIVDVKGKLGLWNYDWEDTNTSKAIVGISMEFADELHTRLLNSARK